MKELIKIIGAFIWILGGGMFIACIFIGLPILGIVLITESILTWIWNYVPQILIVIAVALTLIWGFSEKVNDPLHY